MKSQKVNDLKFLTLSYLYDKILFEVFIRSLQKILIFCHTRSILVQLKNVLFADALLKVIKFSK